MLGEDVYREKITTLRGEEESLKKLLAGYELREIERERSEGYINRVKDFLDGYDDSKEKIDFATKKQLAELLFKNIKIAPAIGGSLPPLIFCFQKQKRNCNVKRIKGLQKYAKKNLHPHLRMADGLVIVRPCADGGGAGRGMILSQKVYRFRDKTNNIDDIDQLYIIEV